MTATEATQPASAPPQMPVDTGLRCPRCEYNLTGLTLPRCPECGQTFDWDAVRRAAGSRPTIAFEIARRWRKVPALCPTWATVLFAPWIFGRQITRRVSGGHALVFALVCFASVLGRLITDWSNYEEYLAWTIAGGAHIVLQALLLSLLDPQAWQQPAAGFRFWLAAGCYTSAVVPTEFWQGPLLLEFSNLPGFVVDVVTFRWIDDLDAWIFMAQFGLWLAGLAFIYAARLRRRWPGSLIALLLLTLPALAVLYSISVEYIGATVWNVLGGSLF